MSYAVVGIVRFGLGAGEEPDKSRWKFYEQVARLVTGTAVKKDPSQSPFRTVAGMDALGSVSAVLEPASAFREPEMLVYARLFEALQDVRPDVDIALLDLSVGTGKISNELMLPENSLSQIGSAIGAFLRSKEKCPDHFIILLPVQSSHLGKQLGDELTVGRVIVLSDDGRSSLDSVDGQEYKTLLASLRARPIDLLSFKLVARLGFFGPVSDSKRMVLRHYFDASCAQEELGHLLEESIGVHDGAMRPDVVVYHESGSGWLYSPLNGACIRADSLPRISYTDLVEQDENVTKFAGKRVLLIVPVVNYGLSLVKKIATVQRRLQPDSLTILSVLCAGGNSEQHGRREIIGLDDRPYTVDYLLQVRQEMVTVEHPMLAIGGPSDPCGGSTDSLTTIEFWDLVQTCGVKGEDDVPGHRDGYKIVPDVPRMLDDYGPWLAEKMWAFIRGRTRTGAHDLLIMCPERESGSTKLSQSLALMAGARIVRIPRSVIQAVVEGARTCEVFDDAYSWCQELDSLATKEIVLVDEFVGDGKTVRAMESIARAKSLEIKATCTLLDFSPDTAEGRHSLYSWRAHSGTFIPGQRRSDESSVARS